jgi:hypothetical protein
MSAEETGKEAGSKRLFEMVGNVPRAVKLQYRKKCWLGTKMIVVLMQICGGVYTEGRRSREDGAKGSEGNLVPLKVVPPGPLPVVGVALST